MVEEMDCYACHGTALNSDWTMWGGDIDCGRCFDKATEPIPFTELIVGLREQ
jgi:hypothetical protein